jgi:hypothetical protein
MDRKVFEAEISKAIYLQLLPMALDKMDLAVNAWKKRGGKVTILKYRKSRKSERLIKVGVSN